MLDILFSLLFPLTPPPLPREPSHTNAGEVNPPSAQSTVPGARVGEPFALHTSRAYGCEVKEYTEPVDGIHTPPPLAQPARELDHAVFVFDAGAVDANTKTAGDGEVEDDEEYDPEYAT